MEGGEKEKKGGKKKGKLDGDCEPLLLIEVIAA